MEDQIKFPASVRYVKPEAINLGATVIIQGGENDCAPTGNNATDDCETGLSAGGYCPTLGQSPANYT